MRVFGGISLLIAALWLGAADGGGGPDGVLPRRSRRGGIEAGPSRRARAISSKSSQRATTLSPAVRWSRRPSVRKSPEEIYAVQQIYALRLKRAELAPSAAFTLNDP